MREISHDRRSIDSAHVYFAGRGGQNDGPVTVKAWEQSHQARPQEQHNVRL